MSWLMVALLGLALAALVGAEWPRLARRLGLEGGSRRSRSPGRRVRPPHGLLRRRRPGLRVVRSEPTESDDFVASVERDLANLPTIEERDRKRR
ncbi:MAG: hypothetical protein ABR521_13820 [Gaiellaceae bacterium]